MVVEQWKHVLSGAGGAVLISGEAGIGKTRLARDLERRFQRDPCLVLQSACYAIEQSDPFAPFLEMLREAHAAPGLSAASPSCLEVVGAFIPEIASRFKAAVTPRSAPIPRQALSASLLDAFVAIAEELALALVVEDLDRASPATIEFVHRLARTARTTHLLVVVTARDVAVRADTGRALRELARSGAVMELALSHLDAADIMHFVGSIARLPADETGRTLAERVHEKTAGVPLYVLELLKALYDAEELQVQDGTWVFSNSLRDPNRPLPVPESTEAILEKRLEILGDTPLQVFAALAVWEREATVQDLVHLTGFGQDVVTDALDALKRRRLVGLADGLPRVLHDELAMVTLRMVAPALVRRFHTRSAELAEQAAALGRPSEWSVAAHHAAAAGDAERAALNAGRAAVSIEETSGPESAAETLRTLLQAIPEQVRKDLEATFKEALGEGKTGSTSG